MEWPKAIKIDAYGLGSRLRRGFADMKGNIKGGGCSKNGLAESHFEIDAYNWDKSNQYGLGLRFPNQSLP